MRSSGKRATIKTFFSPRLASTTPILLPPNTHQRRRRNIYIHIRRRCENSIQRFKRTDKFIFMRFKWVFAMRQRLNASIALESKLPLINVNYRWRCTWHPIKEKGLYERDIYRHGVGDAPRTVLECEIEENIDYLLIGFMMVLFLFLLLFCE